MIRTTYNLWRTICLPSIDSIDLSGGQPLSIPFRNVHDVVCVVIRCWRLYKGSVDVAGERIRRVERIVAAALCRAVVYHGRFILTSIQVVFGRCWLFISIPIVVGGSFEGRLFLKGNGSFASCLLIVSQNSYSL